LATRIKNAFSPRSKRSEAPWVSWRLLTARKLKNVGLNRPTIFVVIDTRDLDEQINETFTACSGVRYSA
jgi:hypothetical protein